MISMDSSSQDYHIFFVHLVISVTEGGKTGPLLENMTATWNNPVSDDTYGRNEMHPMQITVTLYHPNFRLFR